MAFARSIEVTPVIINKSSSARSHVFSQIIKVNFLENVLTVGVYRKNILFCCSFVLSPLLFWRCVAAWWIIICHLWEWRRQWKVCVHVCVWIHNDYKDKCLLLLFFCALICRFWCRRGQQKSDAEMGNSWWMTRTCEAEVTMGVGQWTHFQ